MSSNPWLDTSSVQRGKEVLKEIEIAMRTARKAAADFRDIRTEAERFETDLLRLQKHLRAKPDDWRQVRALIVVDIPAILSAIEGLATISESDARRSLVGATKSAMSAVGPAVLRLEEAHARALQAGLEAAVLGSLSAPRGAPDEDATGFLGGLGRRVLKVTGGATELLSSAQQSVTGFGADISVRATAVVVGAFELGGEYIGEAGRTITRPVTLRAQALLDAATGVGVSALVFGGVASLVFPPIAPFVVGEQLLEMPGDYQRRLASLSDREAQEELRRNGEREERIAGILEAIRGGMLRFDTDHLSITMDPARGTETGIILSGRHTGEMLESIPADEIDLMLAHAPDEGTRRALEAWKKRKAA